MQRTYLFCYLQNLNILSNIISYSSLYIALGPPIYLARVRAAKTGASPIELFLSLTGTATFFKCMPISVNPISKPASALISSNATGSLKAAQA